MEEKKCSECPNVLPKDIYTRKTCSHKCLQARSVRLDREKREANRRVPTRLCDICGKEFNSLGSGNRICPDPACKTAGKQECDKKRKATERSFSYVQVFVGDPWDEPLPLYFDGADRIFPTDVRCGTDPLPCDGIPARFMEVAA